MEAIKSGRRKKFKDGKTVKADKVPNKEILMREKDRTPPISKEAILKREDK